MRVRNNRLLRDNNDVYCSDVLVKPAFLAFRFSHQQIGKVRGSKTRDNEAWSPEIFYYENFALKGFL